ncbi:hypothetical protein UZ35_13930 [Heyndrickxia coagulans]|uniref:Uncharacterized protein n=1 Tax=Heyndrickxia coagulans TaxID=1398 RepID=A0AAN0T654_HEYCO|nr:hypothetical protein SB48_HM08orf04417 [Heyndrickxia coagulans]APB35735.1 hypothetical protein BIZ35_02245 [Heyndrickxia coagulans]ATW83669.1 hypothetical protein CIW84_12050 [Heyndrickxia coagulans]AVD55676.1 hypothetical protein C3766_05830 [Heyndrickxia coagulans]KGB31044.1 hypothetical protein IE89_01305 [Heyndrickxia coagulans]
METFPLQNAGRIGYTGLARLFQTDIQKSTMLTGRTLKKCVLNLFIQCKKTARHDEWWCLAVFRFLLDFSSGLPDGIPFFKLP